MRVLLLHNEVACDASESDRDVLVQAAAVEAGLAELGHQSARLACSLDLDAVRRGLEQFAPDCVFNLVESLGGSDWMAFAATSLLDVLEVPYTGNPTAALLLTNHKLLAKQWLRQAGLPTPEWLATQPRRRDEGPGAASQPFRPGPFIIKAVCEHASVGIGDGSVIGCEDEATLRGAVEEAAVRLHRRVFAERYVEGREFNLSVLAGPAGPQVLPPAEIDFSAFPADKPRIVGYQAKWADDSFEFLHTPRRFDYPESDGPLLADLCRLARECWALFGLRGYARVDFRVDAAGRPWVLEINTNPCLSPDAGFAAAVDRAGLAFSQAVARILDDAGAAEEKLLDLRP